MLEANAQSPSQPALPACDAAPRDRRVGILPSLVGRRDTISGRQVAGLPGIVGQSAALARTMREIRLVAPTSANVMIFGESGTGKELIAAAIHEMSARYDKPLVRVNCGAIPRTLFESEFFGHVRGAFTGAVRDRAGRFEDADGGTLFLDEVGEIPFDLQAKLLRVLQEGELQRIGDGRTRRVDVRVVAATNRDLKTEMLAGRFRQDLYFRLNVIPVEVPALRDRVEDIPLLAEHFLELTSQRLQRRAPTLTQADSIQLQHYDWPGNIRELQNVIERACILSENNRLKFDLPVVGTTIARLQLVETPVLDEESRKQRDRDAIIVALRHARGKVAGHGGAAEILGLKPTTLASRIKALGITKHAVS